MKKLIKFILIAIGAFLSVALGSAFTVQKGQTPTIIAITQIVEHPALDRTREGIYASLAERGFAHKKRNIRIIFESAQGELVLASQIAQRFIGLKPKVIIALGTTSAQAVMAANQRTKIPLVFASVTDPLGAGLVNDLNKHNSSITGVSNWLELKPQLEKFSQMLPLKRLGIIYNPGEANSVSIVKTLRKVGQTMGIKIETSPASTSTEVAQATAAIIKKVDALFISNDNTALSAFESIVNVATASKKPVFVSDVDMVNRGALAALGPDQYQLGWQTGSIVADILEGKAPNTIPVEFPQKSLFIINQKMLKTLGLTIPQQVIDSADETFPSKDPY